MTDKTKMQKCPPYFTIYKVTNLLNGKVYIGKHITSDLLDSYMGSGKYIKRAVKKHGTHNFSKEILHLLDDETEMNLKEAEIVDEDFVLKLNNYNLCHGGFGGWGYVNRTNKNLSMGPVSKRKISAFFKGRKNPGAAERMRKRHKEGLVKYDTFTGRRHSDESKAKMSESSKGSLVGAKNPQYGNMWITDGVTSTRIKKICPVPEGWRKGRIC